MILKQGIAKFGTGDILITPLLEKDTNIGFLVFQNQEQGEIGRLKSTSLFEQKNDDTVFAFTRIESIDVLIERLNLLKNMMQGDINDCNETKIFYSDFFKISEEEVERLKRGE